MAYRIACAIQRGPIAASRGDRSRRHGPEFRALAKKVEEPRQVFLSCLEKASHHDPQLRRALRSIRPISLPLDRAGHTHSSSMPRRRLRQQDMVSTFPPGVRSQPEWGCSRQTSPSGMVKKASLVGKEFMAAFNWRASIGGWTLTDREVADLAAAMQPLVQIRGQWMEVDPVQIASAAAFLAKEGSGKMSAQKLVRHAITGQVETAGLPVVNVVADGELGKLLTGNHDLKPIPALD